mgnify:CR=1 FL=1
MNNIFFTSDLHWDHNKIVDICSRPVEVKDHNDWLIEIWNNTVSKKDIVYILGDVSMASKENTERKFLSKLNGTKHLILGNHDNNLRSSTYFESISQIKTFNSNIVDIDGIPMNIHIELCHYPMMSWNRSVHGSFHCFGHVHGRLEGRGLSIDVGLDAQKYIIPSLEEVLDQLTKKSINLM